MAASSVKQTPISYAQAAKGLATTSSAQQNKPAATPASPPKDMTSSAVFADGSSADPATTTTLVASVNGTADHGPKSQQSFDLDAKKSISRPVSPDAVHTGSAGIMSPQEDDLSTTPNGTSESTWDKQSQVSSSVDRSSQATEASKDKPMENGWDKSPVPVKELKEAPIPAVNVWQQRLAAQEAKLAKTKSATPAGAPASNTTTAAKPPAAGSISHSVPDSKPVSKKKPSEAAAENAGSPNKKKPVEGAKPKSDVPLSVDDASSWPTPQSAQGEGPKKPQEKPQSAEKAEKEKQHKGHGKERWTPVPYVPTAVFSTPLPAVARRGGRSGRGGRENGSHPASSHAGDKPSGTSSSPVTKKPHGGDRSHQSRGAAEGSNSPQETASKGTQTVASGSPEQPKTAPQTSSDSVSKETPRSGKNKERYQNSSEEPRYAHPTTFFGESSFHSRQESKSTSRGQEPHSSRFQADGNGHLRYSVSRERHIEDGPRSAGLYKEPSSFGQQTRDYQRNDTHRERGESRSERGRGGGYRGRGGAHSNYNGTHSNPPYHSAPLAQHQFPPPKSYTLNDRRPQHAGSNSRVNIRSPSMPAPAMYAPAPYPIQTDMAAMYGYPHIPQAPMTAIPYQPYMEQFSLMSMISMQLEYYFSVDNLCKDLFLRKHMDSQGFVLLNFIANFKRIKSLTEDMELLRHVCRQLKAVEYRPGEDGFDRLRKRDNWEQWVLSMEMRDPSAQHDGPAPPTATFAPDFNQENYMISGQREAPVPYTNGFHHERHSPLTDIGNADPVHRPAKLSSMAPEFQPMVVPPRTQNGAFNVRQSVDESSFPYDQIENLVIVVRKPGTASPTQSRFPVPPSHSFSSGSVDAYEAAGGTVASANRSSLANRGFQSLSEKLNRGRREQPSSEPIRSFSGEMSEPVNRHTSTFWVKAKDAPIESLPSDLVHESYNTFREKTLAKRLSVPVADNLLLDMHVLYQFWSHFLVRNFNSKMYNEFKSLAFDDLSVRNSDTGLKYLFRFYDQALSGNNLLPDGVARDLVDTAGSELNKKEKPVLRRLQYAWRNGTFNLESRRKVDRWITDTLRAELEK